MTNCRSQVSLFFDSQNLYSDDFEAKTSENMRYFKDFFFGDTTLFL